jgi:ketosteroid isomerase-like protein
MVAVALTWRLRADGEMTYNEHMSLQNMHIANVPTAIATFLRAVQKHDSAALLATFADGAVLVDGGKEHRGDEIEQWHDRAFMRTRSTVHPINVARRDHKTVLIVIVRGHESGSGGGRPAQLEWSFTTTREGISTLTIVPDEAHDLPLPVESYILAMNTFDLDALLATFADDALVNDQLREYRGRAAIEQWAARDIIGEHVTMYVLKAVKHYGHAIVTAKVDGDYDKRGLPDPLVLAFYFSAHRDRIVQLIILRKEPIYGLSE